MVDLPFLIVDAAQHVGAVGVGGMAIEQPDESVDRGRRIAEQIGRISLDLQRGRITRVRRQDSLGFGESLLRTAIHQVGAGEAQLDRAMFGAGRGGFSVPLGRHRELTPAHGPARFLLERYAVHRQQ